MSAFADITLVCVDDLDPGAALRLLRWQERILQPARALLFTSTGMLVPEKWRVQVASCPRIDSLEAYSQFMVRGLPKYVGDGIDTSHVLVVQRDGYAANPEAWQPPWLRYDYIGASWKGMACHYIEPGHEVGNGGFSLRSVRFLKAGMVLSALLQEHGPIVEDAYLCRHHRLWMEAHGIQYAPLEVAMQFSTEASIYRGEFGFHRSAGPPKDLPSSARQSSCELLSRKGRNRLRSRGAPLRSLDSRTVQEDRPSSGQPPSGSLGTALSRSSRVQGRGSCPPSRCAATWMRSINSRGKRSEKGSSRSSGGLGRLPMGGGCA